jgi:ligand-binding sensor domain-containing protein
MHFVLGCWGLSMKIAILLVLFLFAKCVASNGQDTAGSALRSNAIGKSVKELDKEIWVIFQAKNNDHWFGSNGQGVFRYDGKSLTQFTTKEGLVDDRVREIQEDKSGNIYINTSGGLSKFDGRKFTTLPVAEESGEQWKLQPDDLWFRSGAPLRYDGKSLYRLKLPPTKAGEEWIAKHPKSKFPNAGSPYEVYTQYKDRKGNIWFGTGAAGVCRFDGKSHAWITEEDLTEYHYGPANGVRSIAEDKDGLFWFSNTLFRYEIKDPAAPSDNESAKTSSAMEYNREKGISNSDRDLRGNIGEYMSIAKDEKGDLWIATYGAGVWRYDGKKTTHYPVLEGDKVITVISIYRDHQGDLWLGTHENGARKFNGKTFEKF